MDRVWLSSRRADLSSATAMVRIMHLIQRPRSGQYDLDHYLVSRVCYLQIKSATLPSRRSTSCSADMSMDPKTLWSWTSTSLSTTRLVSLPSTTTKALTSVMIG